MRGRSLSVPREEAFSFHVPLSVPFFATLWTKGQRREVPELRLGDAQLIDLRDNPVVSLDTPFDSLRFYVPQIALDEMANEAGMRPVSGLYAPNFGARDLVLFGLAQALASAMEQPGDGTAMFSDCIAITFFAHIVRAYGSSPDAGRNARGGLASWQLRRAPATSSTPIWRTILRSPRSRMNAVCQPAISAARSSRQPASRPTNG